MLKVISLFSGIGAFEKALSNIGVKYDLLHFCEIDKFAPLSYCAIHNEPISKNLGDITAVDIEALPKCDLITHGSPCQDFSIAGLQKGADGGTRSSLMWNTVEIVSHCKPSYVIWENVKNVLSDKHRHNFDKYVNALTDLGYASYFKVLNAKDYGIPQNRERVFIVSIRKDLKQSFEFPKKQKLQLRLKDMLESEVDEKYYLSDKIIKGFQKHKERHAERGNGFAFVPFETTDVTAHCLDTHEGSRATNNYIKIPQATKQGYIEVEPGGVFDASFPDSNTRRGRVQESGNICPTIQTQNEICRVEPMIIDPQGRTKKICKPNKICPTLRAQSHGNQPQVINNGYRIRKLTPKKCYRLMGFTDEDFSKAKSVPTSDSQLYHQAGNSIVVKVLELIFENLLINKTFGESPHEANIQTMLGGAE